jgi:predicted nucleic acid-binding protein
MGLYLDASCLLKVLFPEPETPWVMQLIAAEQQVVVSTLARLETLVQIHGRGSGGLLKPAAVRPLVARLEALLGQAPYELVHTPSTMIDVAEGHLRRLPREAHCPTRDRLHLASMEAFNLRRLLTNDNAQARAARSLGFTVIVLRTTRSEPR